MARRWRAWSLLLHMALFSTARGAPTPTDSANGGAVARSLLLERGTGELALSLYSITIEDVSLFDPGGTTLAARYSFGVIEPFAAIEQSWYTPKDYDSSALPGLATPAAVAAGLSVRLGAGAIRARVVQIDYSTQSTWWREGRLSHAYKWVLGRRSALVVEDGVAAHRFSISNGEETATAVSANGRLELQLQATDRFAIAPALTIEVPILQDHRGGVRDAEWHSTVSLGVEGVLSAGMFDLFARGEFTDDRSTHAIALLAGPSALRFNGLRYMALDLEFGVRIRLGSSESPRAISASAR